MNLAELDKINLQETDYLLGLFAESYMEYDDARLEDRDPSLTKMAEVAIEVSKRIIKHERKRIGFSITFLDAEQRRQWLLSHGGRRSH